LLLNGISLGFNSPLGITTLVISSLAFDIGSFNVTFVIAGALLLNCLGFLFFPFKENSPSCFTSDII